MFGYSGRIFKRGLSIVQFVFLNIWVKCIINYQQRSILGIFKRGLSIVQFVFLNIWVKCIINYQQRSILGIFKRGLSIVQFVFLNIWVKCIINYQQRSISGHRVIFEHFTGTQTDLRHMQIFYPLSRYPFLSCFVFFTDFTKFTLLWLYTIIHNIQKH